MTFYIRMRMDRKGRGASQYASVWFKMEQAETTRRRRLGVQDWLLAGYRALVRQGPPGLRAEALARDLGTTKGSFYWHFADVGAFRAALLTYWVTRAYNDVLAAVEAETTPAARLHLLAALAVGYRDPDYGGAALEPALRAWAREDAAVAVAVADMDARRLKYVTALCLACGRPDPTLPGLIYAAITGYTAFDAATISVSEAQAGMRALLHLAGVPG